VPETSATATDLDLISCLKAIPDARMRRGVLFPTWYLLLLTILGIQSARLLVEAPIRDGVNDGRYRWPAFCGIQRTESRVQSIEGLIRQLANPPQRMAGRDPLLNRDVGEQGAAALPVTSHLRWAVGPFSQRWLGFSANS